MYDLGRWSLTQFSTLSMTVLPRLIQVLRTPAAWAPFLNYWYPGERLTNLDFEQAKVDLMKPCNTDFYTNKRIKTLWKDETLKDKYDEANSAGGWPLWGFLVVLREDKGICRAEMGRGCWSGLYLKSSTLCYVTSGLWRKQELRHKASEFIVRGRTHFSSEQ